MPNPAQALEPTWCVAVACGVGFPILPTYKLASLDEGPRPRLATTTSRYLRHLRYLTNGSLEERSEGWGALLQLPALLLQLCLDG